MDAGIRRQEILDRLAATRRPLAATRLGAQLGVSRQVIVGDVALLRAEGHPIRATNRGYVLARPATRPHRSIFVQHTREDIAIELSAIIKVGGSVLDVSVEHRLYGQITVDLLIRSPEDLAHFLARLPRSTALSELTNGWHTHTIEASMRSRPGWGSSASCGSAPPVSRSALPHAPGHPCLRDTHPTHVS